MYIAFRKFSPRCKYSLQGTDGATREIKGKRYFEERVAEAKFRAIMIQAGFRRWRPFDVPTGAMIIVALWKVSGGTWEAAFACGGFFIMLVRFRLELGRASR